METVEKVAATVLYEGYLLWPYRRSAIKNQKRWNFGGVFPRAFSESSGTGDPWQMQTQCLVTGTVPSVAVKVKFLQAVDRKVARNNSSGDLEYVESIQVGSERHVAWEEARERDLSTGFLRLKELATLRTFDLSIREGSDEESLIGADGVVAGVLVYTWKSLTGMIEISAEEIQDQVFRLTIRLSNHTPWDERPRDETLKQTLLSAHTILEAADGEFVSLTDPPDHLEAAAHTCVNLQTWPVLVGETGEKRYLLSSPIILPDYPQIAPESPGMMFDSTEVDQLLMLNILALTDEEKAEIRATDPRAREILERSEAMGVDDFMQLHGTIRDFRTLRGAPEFDPVFETLEMPPPESVLINGVEIRKGSKVLLRPRAGGDIWDIALADKVAYIESIEQDYDGRIQVAVTLEDDPGRDLGERRFMGHRFFFSPEEVQPLDRQGGAR